MAVGTDFSLGSGEREPTGEASGIGERAGFLSFGGSTRGSGSGTGSGNDSEGASGETDSSGTRFDPAIHSGPDKLNRDGTFRKKRGRKAGTGSGANRGKASDYSASLDAFTGMLAIVHVGLASVTKTPELVLEEDEAKSLAMASANVLEQFDITPDPRVTAVLGLVTTCGMIYGPRVYLIRERKREEKEKSNNA